jgi:electron-transferring-flavoprotein dehydrogenase
VQKNVPLALATMWENMCPAAVYAVPDEVKDRVSQNGGAFDEDELVDLQITPSNCVQCGAITAKGGRLTPPEGGDGPNYQQT